MSDHDDVWCLECSQWVRHYGHDPEHPQIGPAELRHALDECPWGTTWKVVTCTPDIDSGAREALEALGATWELRAGDNRDNQPNGSMTAAFVYEECDGWIGQRELNYLRLGQSASIHAARKSPMDTPVYIGRPAPSGEERYTLDEVYHALYNAEKEYGASSIESLWTKVVRHLRAAAPEHGEEEDGE